MISAQQRSRRPVAAATAVNHPFGMMAFGPDRGRSLKGRGSAAGAGETTTQARDPLGRSVWQDTAHALRVHCLRCQGPYRLWASTEDRCDAEVIAGPAGGTAGATGSVHVNDHHAEHRDRK